MMHKKPEDLKREESLFNYLCKSYLDYQKGQQSSINKIIDEVCRRNKEVSLIQQWMDLFIRLLLQLQRSGNDTKLIIDIVLYKIPWFCSENHFQAITHFKRIIFTILSINSNLIGQIYRLLIGKFNMQIMIDQEQTKYDVSCTIRNIKFADKTHLNDKIIDITHTYELTQEDQLKILNNEDKEFMMEIFKHHPRASHKLDKISDIGYGYFPAKNRTKCFYIIRKDNTTEDISYVKAMEGLYDDLFRQHFFVNGETKYSIFAIQMISEIDIIYKLHRNKLMDVINEQFPHKNQNDMSLRAFTLNTLKLAERIPDIASKLIKILFTKFLSIDSEIKYDHSFNNIIIKTRNFHQNKNKEHKDEMAKKLDQLMFLVFDFLNSKQDCTQTENSLFKRELNDELIVQCFKELQKLFQETVLKNQYYRMAHFVYIYFCSMGDKFKNFQQLFITQLILNIKSSTLPKSQRVNSIYYLSSLLVRCNQIQATVFVKAVQLILDYFSDEQRIKEPDYDCHIVQMLAFLISTKSQQLESIRQPIHQTILDANTAINALSTLHYDVLVKFNDVLLRTKSDECTEKLIELTATIITKQLDKRCPGDVITTHHSPNTPQFPFKDQESHMSRQSIWTSISKQSNQAQLDFHQPFNTLTLVYSENFIKPYYKYDCELIKEEGGSLNNSQFIDCPSVKKSLFASKRTRTCVDPIAGETPEKKVRK